MRTLQHHENLSGCGRTREADFRKGTPELSQEVSAARLILQTLTGRSAKGFEGPSDANNLFCFVYKTAAKFGRYLHVLQ